MYVYCTYGTRTVWIRVGATELALIRIGLYRTGTVGDYRYPLPVPVGIRSLADYGVLYYYVVQYYC